MAERMEIPVTPDTLARRGGLEKENGADDNGAVTVQQQELPGQLDGKALSVPEKTYHMEKEGALGVGAGKQLGGDEGQASFQRQFEEQYQHMEEEYHSDESDEGEGEVANLPLANGNIVVVKNVQIGGEEEDKNALHLQSRDQSTQGPVLDIGDTLSDDKLAAVPSPVPSIHSTVKQAPSPLPPSSPILGRENAQTANNAAAVAAVAPIPLPPSPTSSSSSSSSRLKPISTKARRSATPTKRMGACVWKWLYVLTHLHICVFVCVCCE